MMTLDEAIKHCEEVAEKVENDCIECAKDHEQLAGWLTELKQLREQTRWIPVSERLPKAGEYIGDGDVAKYYLVQNEYGDMMVARYTHSEYWEQIYKLKPIGDEIVAWRELPEPYVPDINVVNINCILDKISNKIKHCREDEEPHLCDYRYYINVGLDMALNIIDNYKTESEDEE